MNMQEHLYTAWAQYYYIENSIETKINEILNEDANALSSDFYTSITFNEDVIQINVAPTLTYDTITRINRFLGNTCDIQGVKNKKSGIRLIYEYPTHDIDEKQMTFD